MHLLAPTGLPTRLGKGIVPIPQVRVFLWGAQHDCELKGSLLDSAKCIPATAAAALGDFTICAAQLHLH